MNLYEMKLGESFWSPEMDSSILRVPGGWLFRGWDQERGVHTSITFVPFNNEFMEIPVSAESPATDRQQLMCAIELLKRAQADLTVLDFDNGNCSYLVSAIDNFVATAHI